MKDRLQKIKKVHEGGTLISQADISWLIAQAEVLTAENNMFADFITELSDMIIDTNSRMRRLSKNEQ